MRDPWGIADEDEHPMAAFQCRLPQRDLGCARGRNDFRLLLGAHGEDAPWMCKEATSSA